MKNLKSSSKKILLLAFLLLVLTGCSRYTNADGTTMAEKVIYSTTGIGEMFSNESWFTAILVYPIAQLINFSAPLSGVVIAVCLATIIVNLITLPLTIKSTAGTQKMQMVQPEMNRIQKKYEGRDDERSRMQQAQELQNLYKKYDINPLGTLVGSFVTLPIVLAMYQAVMRADAVVNGNFFGADLQLSPWKTVRGVGGTPAIVCIVIFLLMGVSQFVAMNINKWLAKNSKMTKNHGQEEKNPNDMMTYSFLIMIVFMGATLPTAMSVYWAANSVVTILKTIYIQKVVVEKGK